MLHCLGKPAKFMLKDRPDPEPGMVICHKVASLMTTSRALYVLEGAKHLLVHKHGKSRGRTAVTRSPVAAAFIHLSDADPQTTYELLSHLWKQKLLTTQGNPV